MTRLAQFDDQELSIEDRQRLAPLLPAIRQAPDTLSAWHSLTHSTSTTRLSCQGYRCLWDAIFSDWDETTGGPRPMWSPSEVALERANITSWLRDLHLRDVASLHAWSVENRAEFWRRAINQVGVAYRSPPSEILDDRGGPTAARWLPDARLNIVESCFLADDRDPAIVYSRPDGELQRVTYQELRQQVARVAHGLQQANFKPGEAIAVLLPMTAESVAIYLGIIAAGCAVVSIADSFAPPQIAERLKIARARAIFTYDYFLRSDKQIDLYQRVVDCHAPRAIVLPSLREGEPAVTLRNGDITWNDFLSDNDHFSVHVAAAEEPINILFSSGTTGDPKAIPWNHTTPIKCAVDGLLHHDLHHRDVVAWPTNLGWMMGPWLIFASLMNRATMAFFEDAPTGQPFGHFVQDAGVTMLGVVPTLVSAWQATGCMEDFDWSAIRVFSSTGEASNPEGMFYLSSLAGFRPIIEYCGGTEIGGGYMTSTVVQPNAPATFSTAAMGLDITILDEQGQQANEGELFLVPPSIGLSKTLLNRDHDATYHEGVPADSEGRRLRRHGDHFRKLPGGYFVAGGRVDDTMNLGGIKVSSAEIEKALNQLPGILESAAVTSPIEASDFSHRGPEQLTVFFVRDQPQSGDERTLDVAAGEPDLLIAMNRHLKEQLNPLFKVQRLVEIDEMPRTASNKVMRRKLRDSLRQQDSD